MIQIYYCEITDIGLSQDVPLNILAYCEKYREKGAKRASIAAWMLLNDALKKNNIDLSKKIICLNEYGKPYLKGTNLYFNLSHSKNMAAVALSNCKVGIDIEAELCCHQLDALSNKILSPLEAGEYKRANGREYLTAKWTQKEAYYKMLGTSIDLNGLKSLEVKNCTTKQVFDSQNNNYYLSVINKRGEKIY